MACAHVELREGGTVAAVCHRGAALVALTVDGTPVIAPGPPGPCVPEQYRGVVLAPWPNRLYGGSYEHGGVRHAVTVDEPATGSALHGLVAWREWAIASVSDGAAVLSTTLDDAPGYPFQVELRATYRVHASGIHATVVARNTGNMAAPVGLGAHPYFTAGVSVDATRLQIDAAETGADWDAGVTRTPVAASPLDFRTARPIGATQLDHAFTGLIRDHHGWSEARLVGADNSVVIRFGPSARWLMVFTSDTLAPPARRAGVAVEPMTCPPNALRNGVDLAALAPGEEAALEWSAARYPLEVLEV